MQIQALMFLVLGTVATAVVASDAGIGTSTAPKATPTRFPKLTSEPDTLQSPHDFPHDANDVQRRAKAPAKPKAAVKPKPPVNPATPKNPPATPATPAKPSGKPVVGTPAPGKPTPPVKGTPVPGQPTPPPSRTPTLKSTMQTSFMSKSGSMSSSSAMPSSSAVAACPMRPRKRSVEDFVELDSWMGFDQTSERRYTVVVLG
jgi:hypothetical protein